MDFGGSRLQEPEIFASGAVAALPMPMVRYLLNVGLSVGGAGLRQLERRGHGLRLSQDQIESRARTWLDLIGAGCGAVVDEDVLAWLVAAHPDLARAARKGGSDGDVVV